MELVAGGTLKERVARTGPLPVLEAVDICLQMIAGLEVAAAAGVLHRDIKPANCFVEPGGPIKVGDFGLSISTLARTEPQLTMSGCFVGTPAFSSPEQLRGEELDCRSDIYSVGMTLYFLLTGKTAFDGDNFVKLLATVLEKAPSSPASLRRDIPRGLATLVLRCLAKKPEQRFRDYAGLRRGLEPFAGRGNLAASLPLRAGAGLVDGALITGLLMGAGHIGAGGQLLARFPSGDASALGSSIRLLPGLGACLLQIAYYSVAEGRWGATPGKLALKLRLVDLPGQPARWRQALLRALVFVLLPESVQLLAALAFDLDFGKSESQAIVSGSIDAGILLFGLLFITARRRNGWAGLHDLLSGTRVITVSSPNAVRGQIQARTRAVSPEALPERIGPYHSSQRLDQIADHGIVTGYDPQLLRQLWIRKLPQGTPHVPLERQNLSRPARIRSIIGRRSSTENWDAYEALSGGPLLSRSGARSSWVEVRSWLLDLAQELDAGARTQTLPPCLSPDRLWICANGQLKILDFAAPADLGERTPHNFPPAESPVPEIAVPSRFDALPVEFLLKQVAWLGLAGRMPRPDRDASKPLPIPLPLHARAFLEKLDHVPSWDSLVDELRGLLSRPGVVTKGHTNQNAHGPGTPLDSARDGHGSRGRPRTPDRSTSVIGSLRVRDMALPADVPLGDARCRAQPGVRAPVPRRLRHFPVRRDFRNSRRFAGVTASRFLPHAGYLAAAMVGPVRSVERDLRDSPVAGWPAPASLPLRGGALRGSP